MSQGDLGLGDNELTGSATPAVTSSLHIEDLSVHPASRSEACGMQLRRKDGRSSCSSRLRRKASQSTIHSCCTRTLTGSELSTFRRHRHAQSSFKSDTSVGLMSGSDGVGSRCWARGTSTRRSSAPSTSMRSAKSGVFEKLLEQTLRRGNDPAPPLVCCTMPAELSTRLAPQDEKIIEWRLLFAVWRHTRWHANSRQQTSSLRPCYSED